LFLAGMIVRYVYEKHIRHRLLRIRRRTPTCEKVVEICLSDIESCRNALDGGANSIELCVDRGHGGVTPSFGLIQEACRLESCQINVLIRPRDGNFVYTDDEFDVILRDIIAVKNAGATGKFNIFNDRPYI
jgi:hypothetical protein